MIVREEADRLLLIRQADHSMLSGWLAAMWGAGPWERPQPYSSCVVAARLHDLIWVPWDEALPRRPDGRPYNFREVPRQAIIPYQQRGIDAVEALDAYAGLLVSLHFSGFYRSQWGWEHGEISAEDRDVVDEHLRHEDVRQRRIRKALAWDDASERHLECNYKWLQMWDRISREICAYGFDSGFSIEEPALPARAEAGAEEVRLRIALEPGGVCRLDPYPLTVEPYRARIPCVSVPLDDLGSLEGRWLAAGDEALEVTFLPA